MIDDDQAEIPITGELTLLQSFSSESVLTAEQIVCIKSSIKVSEEAVDTDYESCIMHSVNNQLFALSASSGAKKPLLKQAHAQT